MAEQEEKSQLIKDIALSRRAFVGLIAAGSISLLLPGCGTSRSEANSDASSGNAKSGSQGNDSQAQSSGAGAVSSAAGTAIVCFSYDGHTWAMANRIAELAGVTPNRIEPDTPYPDSATGDEIKGYHSAGYDETVDIAKEEQSDNAMPAYTVDISGWDRCDVVFLGYPIWWGDVPQVVKNFARQQDWSGKTVVPFSSNEGSRWGSSLGTLKTLCSGATFLDGIAIRGEEVPTSLESINTWYEGLAL